ncbi:MAG: hypothetical protein V2B19_12710 [Pseudomonadota bacterium]
MKSMKKIWVMMVLWGLMQYPALAKKDSENDLPSGLQQKIYRGGEHTSGGLHRQYRKGEILDRQTCDRSAIVEPENQKGVIGIQVEDKVLRVIRSTREIVDIVEGK